MLPGIIVNTSVFEDALINVEFELSNVYTNCDNALEDNSKKVVVTPYLTNLPGSLELLVDKKYKVGDYIHYELLKHGKFLII